jgi:hypothetical protein
MPGNEDINSLSEIEDLVSTYGQWTKEKASYTELPVGTDNSCSSCYFYREGSCLIVEGDISPTAQCRLWIMTDTPQDLQEEVIEEVPIPQHLSQTPTEETPSPASIYPLETLYLSASIAKVPLAKKGKWKHDTYGVVEFTDQDFEQIISNLATNSLGHPAYLTFGHIDEEPNSTDSHKKRGDLKEVKVEGDVLYGFFDARPQAEQAIANGEYEFSSGEFLRNFTDKESGVNRGTVFMRAALTNSPFLPFSENEKIQLLSTSTLDVQPFVINLIKDQPVNIDPIQEESMTTQLEAPQEQVDTKVAPLEVQPTEVVTTPIEEPKAPPTPSPLDIPGLVAQITGKVEATYKEQLDTALSTIEGLKTTLAQVTEDLSSQKQVTQAYSQSVSRQEEANLNQSLLSSGVPATLVQSFSDIRGALRNKQESIKLSIQGAEQDVTLVHALSQMLVDAVKAEAVPYGQVGAAQPKSDSSGVVSEIEAIIAANKARIK